MFSATGMIPCQLCPRHTFAGPPPIGGYKECEPCPEVNIFLEFLTEIFVREHIQLVWALSALAIANNLVLQGIFL